MDDFSSRTTKIRLGAPLNADLLTTVFDRSHERPEILSGATLEILMGPLFADNYVVGVQENPEGNRKGVVVTHFRRVKISDQDKRNAQITEGDVLVRTYILHRDDYPTAGPASDYKLPVIAVGAADVKFPRYGYTHEALLNGDFGLDQVFVVVQRYYQQLVKTDTFWDDDLEMKVRETVEIVAHEPAAPDEIVGAGFTIRRETVNTFYDRLVKRQLLPAGGGALSFPIKLKDTAADISFSFPPVLIALKLVSAYAWSVAGNGRNAYGEDFYFDPTIRHPFPGPHPGRILRFITNDPEAVRDQYQLVQWVEEADTIPLLAAWWYADAVDAQAFALAKQISLPPTVHGAIPINGIETLAIVQQKSMLSPTPGWVNFANAGLINVACQTSPIGFGLYMVEVRQVDPSGVYNSQRGEFGAGKLSGVGDNYVDITPPPEVRSATISPDNRIVTGLATAGAAVTVSKGNLEIGKVMSDASGTFSLTLTTVYTDPVDLSVKARKGGVLSGAFILKTFDLAPATPTAFVNSARSLLEGKAQPGAAIRISMPTQAQVTTATVVGTIASDGNAIVTFTSALTGPRVLLVDVLTGNNASVIATKVRSALLADPLVNEHFVITLATADVVGTARVGAYNDSTLNIAIENGTCTGIVPAPTSAATTQGLGPVTTTAAATGPTAGEYSFTFAPVLPSGTVLTITASDAGGESSPVVIKATATPPSLYSVFWDVDSFSVVTGLATAGTNVTARYLGAAVGTAVTDGGGVYSITLDRLFYSGEVLSIIATDAGDPAVQSVALDLVAENLELPKPAFTSTSVGYIGTAPAETEYPIHKVVIRYEGTGEEVEFDVFPANNEFLVSLNGFSSPIGNLNGERYEVFFRFYIGSDPDPESDPGNLIDGPAEWINSPRVPLPGAVVRVAPPAEFYNKPDWIPTDWPGARRNSAATSFSTGDIALVMTRSLSTIANQTSSVMVPANKMVAILIANPIPGTVIHVKFPGQNVADIGPMEYTGPIYLADIPSFPFVKLPVNSPYPPGVGWPTSGYTPQAGWYQNGAYPTRAAVRAVIPPFIRVHIKSPDGRETQTIYERDKEYPYNDPVYSYEMGL